MLATFLLHNEKNNIFKGQPERCSEFAEFLLSIQDTSRDLSNNVPQQNIFHSSITY